ncbi:GbsR/MarR family transcriptional regulator [Streptomyces macrosporus]|uniref:GbsR/MarR family transcriptional regulator n=1 Tax=Streptomyces macrosporus TaxID=44032 RepID=UPI003CD06A9A
MNGQSNKPEEADEKGIKPYYPEVAEFVERFAAELTEAGMQRMAARVFACLLAEDSGALGSVELAERLRVSPAAISGAVRYLSQMHLVTREREPGSRRERYRVHADTWYGAVADRDRVLGRWIATFERGVKAVGPDTSAGRRLAETAEFFGFMRGELSRMMERWYAHRDALRAADDGPASS